MSETLARLLEVALHRWVLKVHSVSRGFARARDAEVAGDTGARESGRRNRRTPRCGCACAGGGDQGPSLT